MHGASKICRDPKTKQRQDHGNICGNDGHDIHGYFHRNCVSDSPDVNHSGSTCHSDELRVASIR